MTGKITHCDYNKKFGFIHGADDNSDIFFHISDCPYFDSCLIGDVVQFDTRITPKGLRAIGVRRV